MERQTLILAMVMMTFVGMVAMMLVDEQRVQREAVAAPPPPAHGRVYMLTTSGKVAIGEFVGPIARSGAEAFTSWKTPDGGTSATRAPVLFEGRP
jgi:hypothetical protein